MSATTTPFKFRWYLGVAAGFLVFFVVAVYSSRMAHNTGNYDSDQAQIRYARLAKMQAADQTNLTTADWVDQAKGTVRIPVDEAMTEEVPALQAKPVAEGGAIAGTTAAAPVAATNAAPAAATHAASDASASNSTKKPAK